MITKKIDSFRHNISLKKEDEEKLQPLLIKHGGNYSAAIRESIELALNKKMVPDYSDSVMLFDSRLANFLLKKTTGIIPEREILEEIIDSQLSNSIFNALEYFNAKFKELEWEIELSLNCDSSTVPTTAELIIKGENYLQIDLSARIFSLFLAIKKSIGIAIIHRRSKSIELPYKRRGNSKAALNDLKTHLGIMQDLFCEIEKKPDFWQGIEKKYKESNYNMVLVDRNHYEDLLAKKNPTGEYGIELIAKHPIKDIPHSEFINLMKEDYESAGIVENIDVEGDTIRVFHTYRDPQAVNTLKDIFLNLFKSNGLTYNAKCTKNMIIFQHIPKIGICLSLQIENLEKTHNDFDRELITFLKNLNGLKDKPETDALLRMFGYNMSKQIFEKYEKEYKIREWDLKTFWKTISVIDSKIGRVSEFRSIDGNKSSINYTVKKCNLVYMGEEFNNNICKVLHGFMKGALKYAFENKAEIKVIKQLANNNDNKCEFFINCVKENENTRSTEQM